MPENTCHVRAITTSSLQIRTERRFNTVIANYIYEHPGILDLNLQGIWIADRTLLIRVIVARGITYQSIAYQRLFRGTLFKNKSPQWILYTNMNMSLH
jgi:hypothetical protein